ncbi:hypothetical protein DXG03_000272 [Asterophora parasitica]|uniref:Uncharacterized protein n=1 Tax=Asterophora parasitica TaxID=117018 RepID=A0A9P7GF58_9AGAR|nr:hypothetical protein DXG03_000272 [Asterophora parasitica]
MYTCPLSLSPKWFKTTKPPRAQKPLNDHFGQVQSRLPPELLLATAQFIYLPRDVLKLSLASQRIYVLLLPALYASIECKTYHRCKERLSFLLERPDLALYIKKIILRPNPLMSSFCLDEEMHVSDAFERLIPKLSGLETFIWDGLEPPEENLWTGLRTQYVIEIGDKDYSFILASTAVPAFATLGVLLEIHFFEEIATDLEGFSLITNYHEHPMFITLFQHPDFVQLFPDSMWTMLLERCSNLKELTLGGDRTSYYTPLFDVQPLVRGRWPKLHSLLLGHTTMLDSGNNTLDWDSRSQREIKNDFSCFISSHPLLGNLRIPYDTRFPPLDLSGSEVVIKEFCGTHFYLGCILPHSHLTSLTLCSERLETWRLLPCLRELKYLLNLEVWIDLSHRNPSTHRFPFIRDPETEHIEVFQPLARACPSLLRLKIMCTTKRKSGFLMKDFWKSIESNCRLQSLEVQKVYSIGEESMARSALRIACHVPSLRHITLFYAKEPWSGLTRVKVKQTGDYDISTSDDGESLRVMASENALSVHCLKLFNARDEGSKINNMSQNPRTAFSSVSITFLGTASAQPSSTRNHSALALHLGRDVWIFDCGEATQHQIQKSGVKMGRIEKIFITHTHGMLTAVLRLSPLEIYGPLGTRAYVRNGLAYTHTLLGRPYVVHELRTSSDTQVGDFTSLTHLPFELLNGRNISQVDGVWPDIFKDDIVSVSAGPILHSIPCVGFVVTEAPVAGRIDPKKYIPDLKRTNTPMSVMRRLQQGESVELSDGTIIHGPPRRKGRKVVILGDTFDPSPIVPLAVEADLLVHEATNAHLPGVDPATKDSDTYESVEVRARQRGHSTPQLAGAFARRIRARRLVLNHFSARYSGGDTEDAVKIMDAIADLAAKEFGQKVQCAKDLMSVEVVFPDQEVI